MDKKGIKKGIAKKTSDSSKRKFFVQKSGEDRKAGAAKVDKNNSENHRNHKEGQTEQDKMCLHKKKPTKRTKSKMVKKGYENNEGRKIQGEDKTMAETRREEKREKKKAVEKRR